MSKKTKQSHVTHTTNVACHKFFLLAYSAINRLSTLLSSIFLHLSFFRKSTFGNIRRAALIDVGFGSTAL